MIIVTTKDFVGFQSLASSIEINKVLQYFIDKYEARYINQLLGASLATLFIADCQANNGVPVIPRFLTIFKAFDMQDGARIRHSNGIKDLLLDAICYQFVFRNDSQHSQAGVVNNEVDTTTKLTGSDSSRFAELRFNDMLDTWDEIQWYIRKNQSTYPEFVQVDPPTAVWSALL